MNVFLENFLKENGIKKVYKFVNEFLKWENLNYYSDLLFWFIIYFDLLFII